MTTRLTLLCHGPTAAVKAAAFPEDEPLDDAAVRTLAGASARLGRADRIVTSPALCARQTAEALGLTGVVDPSLRECDYGRWAGRTFADVQEQDADGLAAWLSDPGASPHGGEPLTDLIGRVAGWLAAEAARPGTLLAVAHASVMRAAIVSAIAAPPSSFWRIDVAPLAMVRLSGHAGRWNLVGIGPLRLR